jgi:hypothetical protein
MIPRLEVWTSDLIDFEQKNPVLGRPVRVRDGRADEPFKPNVDWDEVQLLCVGATTSFGSKLWAGSGRGDAAVHVAAPGERIAVAARPSFDRRQSFDAYRVARGSSFAAPMVAGAAALLRRAAPGAPINDIREALQAGARQSHDLRGKVKFGSLDIACALRALNERKEPSWDMVVIGDLTDSRDYNAFIDSTTPVCRERPPQVVRFQRPLRTSEVFDNAGDDAQAGRHDTLQSLIDSAELQNDALSTSLAWQARLLQLADTTWDAGRAAFPVTEGLLRPIVPPERPVYDAGTMSVGCPEDGFHMTGLRVYFPDFIAPKGWVFPTDALEEPPKGKRVQLAIALAKPWYSALLGDTIRIRAIVRCEFFPGLP